jgi:putative ABC transport system permease protein
MERLTGGANPLWTRAPTMLLRYPGLFAALALGSMLLVVAAAAYPLFVSASAAELFAERVDDPLVTSFGAGARYRNGSMPLIDAGTPDAPEVAIDEALDRLFEPVPHLEPIVATILGPGVGVSTPGGDEVREVRPFVGESAIAHVRRLSGSQTRGTWMPQLAAETLGVRPGDEIVLSNGQRSATITVDGVYRDIFRAPDDGYWRPWNHELVLTCFDCPPPPQPLIVGRALFDDLVSELRLRNGGFAWQAPLEAGLSMDEAIEVKQALQTLSERATDVSTPEGRTLQTCYSGFCGVRVRPSLSSSIEPVMSDVARRVSAVESPAQLLRVAGLLVALVVVAASGAFAMSARRVESGLLFARGTGPGTVGARAGLEALVPCLTGGALGLGLAFALIAAVGPDGPIAASARADAVRTGTAAAIVAVLTIAVVSSVSFLRQSERHRTRLRFLAKIPWELALVALALWVLDRLRSDGALVPGAAPGTQRPSALLLLFPVLFLAGFAALAARLAISGLGAARRRSARLPPAAFLAVRRLVATPQLTVLLVGASGLCLGLFVQAQSMASSMRTTVDAKAGVYVGSDVQARVEYSFESPGPSFGAPYTRVTRIYQAGAFGVDRTFDLLAVDADTFADAAFWDEGFAEASLDELMASLDGETGTGGLPAIIARPTGREPDRITVSTSTVPIEVVGSATAFPGMSSLRPLLVVDEERLHEALGDVGDPLALPGASTELWIRGTKDEAAAAIASLPYVPSIVLTTQEVKDIPHIAAVIDTFLVLNALGLAAAMLVLASIVMYLQARQRSQLVAYGLSVRMGMGAAGHRRAVAAELAAMLGVAALVGVGLAIVAARLVVPLLDPITAVPPDPIPVIPLTTIWLLPLGLALVVLCGAWLTERRARSVDLGQVMRLAD